MPPAGQRLKTGDGTVLEPHHRTKQHGDLASLERTAHIILEHLPIGALRPHRWREHFDPVTAGFLGVGKTELRIGEKVAAFQMELRVVDRGADRDGQSNVSLAEANLRCQRGAQRLHARLEVLARIVEHNRSELVARQPRKRIPGLQIARQAPRHRQ